MSYASLERPDTEAEHSVLSDMTIQALQQKAQGLGVDEAALDDAEENAARPCRASQSGRGPSTSW